MSQRSLSVDEQDQMSRKHIFCVNGSSSFLDFVRLLFEDEDYNVTTTNFVPNTFEQIAALRPSMLIIDLEFGRQAGFELLERLKNDAVTNQIPVMVVSTTPELLDKARADEARYGANTFLAKPFDLKQMLEGVQQVIGKA